MNQKQAVVTAVTMLSESFRQPLTEAAIEGYAIGLEDLTHEQLAVATKRAIRESKFMPTPAELRAFAGMGGPRALEAAAIEAWEAVRRAMDEHDYTDSVDFGPLVNAVVRNLGGWQWLCDQKVTGLPFVRKDFERVYGLLVTAHVGSLRGEALRGSLGAPAVRIRIGAGPAPLRQIESSERAPVAAVVRELANGKAFS